MKLSTQFEQMVSWREDAGDNVDDKLCHQYDFGNVTVSKFPFAWNFLPKEVWVRVDGPAESGPSSRKWTVLSKSERSKRWKVNGLGVQWTVFRRKVDSP